MAAIITAFSAPGDFDALCDCYDNGGTNLSSLFSDCSDGYTTWTVDRKSDTGDIVFFYCSKKSMTRIAHSRVEAKANGNAQLITFADEQYQRYKEYASNLVAIGVAAEKAYADGRRYVARVIDLKWLDNPLPYSAFNDFITLIPGAAITRLNDEQETKLLDLINGDFKTDPLESKVEIPDPTLTEGKRIETYGTKYERNPKVRAAFLAQSPNPYKCAVCGFDFEKVYGKLGKYYIEVHHIKPLSSIGKDTAIDPGKDLVSLCSNCHRMIHRNGILTVDALKEIVKQA